MEIQFEEPKKSLRPKRVNKFKGRNKRSETRDKFVGVRQRPSGRYVAEIKDTTQNIRMWLGTFETAEEAARAYDEAATLLRGSNTRTNFVTHVSYDSPLASRIKHLLNNQKKGTKQQEDTDVISSTTSRADTSSGTTHSTSAGSTTSRPDTPSGTTTSTNPSSTTNSTSTSNVASTSVVGTDAAFDGPSVAAQSQSPPASFSINSSNNKINEKIENSISSETTIQNTKLFDDAYRPDLSKIKEYELGSKSNVKWDFGPIFDHFHFGQGLDMTNSDGILYDMVDEGVSEFERMKVERQISASLYAINGVQEYMETVHDSNEALWNLSPFCSFLC